MLKRKGGGTSFPGDYLIGQRGIRGHGCTKGVHDYAEAKVGSGTSITNPCTVLEEYDDVFPQDLPLGLPPVREGHEFKINLEDDVPPVHRPLYKMSPLDAGRGQKAN